MDNLLTFNGCKFEAIISHKTVPEGMICVENGIVYLLQDCKEGSAPSNKHGYSCGWCVDKGTPDDLRLNAVCNFFIKNPVPKFKVDTKVQVIPGTVQSVYGGFSKLTKLTGFIVELAEYDKIYNEYSTYVKFDNGICLLMSEGELQEITNSIITYPNPGSIIKYNDKNFYVYDTNIHNIKVLDDHYQELIINEVNFKHIVFIKEVKFKPIFIKIGDILKINKLSSWAGSGNAKCPLGNIPGGSYISVSDIIGIRGLDSSDSFYIAFCARYNGNTYGMCLSNDNDFEIIPTVTPLQHCSNPITSSDSFSIKADSISKTSSSKLIFKKEKKFSL